MPLQAPSRQLLQYLTSFALKDSRPARSATRSATRSICLAARDRLPTSRLDGKSGTRPTLRTVMKQASTRSKRAYSSSPICGAEPTPSQSDNATSPTPATPDISNYYTLFPSTLSQGPPPSGPFAITLPTLRREFLQLQSLHHPDKHPPSTAAHKTSLALSALLNNAYRTLSDPLLRAQYLLDLKYSIDVMSEDNSAHATDQATLMAVMEAQEEIEEANTEAQIEELKDENAQRITETVERMADAFEVGDGETAKNECVRLKYWRSLQEGLNDWEPGKEVRLIH